MGGDRSFAFLCRQSVAAGGFPESVEEGERHKRKRKERDM
jgi:hypothetical protein